MDYTTLIFNFFRQSTFLISQNMEVRMREKKKVVQITFAYIFTKAFAYVFISILLK